MELFRQMQQEGVQPAPVTFGGVPNAPALLHFKRATAHKQIVESRKDSDVFVRSSLVDMYAKCGSMEEALSVQ